MQPTPRDSTRCPEDKRRVAGIEDSRSVSLFQRVEIQKRFVKRLRTVEIFHFEGEPPEIPEHSSDYSLPANDCLHVLSSCPFVSSVRIEHMTLKASDQESERQKIDRFDGGVSWIAHPEETMQRASHALDTPEGVWVVDPVDFDGLDEVLAEYGEVAGVVVLLDRHKRDCAALANRHDVAVWVPEFFDGVAADLPATVERFSGELGDSGFALHTVVDNSFWQEGLLFSPETGVLVVPESVGTAEYFRTDDRKLGVHPMLRLLPPTVLLDFEPTRILLGHGQGIHRHAPELLEDAIAGSQARAPRLYAKTFKNIVSD